MQPLDGVTVLDFSTLLPGPLAGLLLAEAGADVIKIERTGFGEEARHYYPQWGGMSAVFALLNRGKRSIALDLKNEADRARLVPLIANADVILEQFRPGVMDRLGLGYDKVRDLNPRVIYCSITGYGQTGPKKMVAAHDLNYIGDAGLLALSPGERSRETVPPFLAADIAGGTYPAVVNILLALIMRERTGEGARLDISMTDNVFMLMSWALAEFQVGGRSPEPGSARLTGGSPRYHIYRTRDSRLVAAAPLEQKFWDTLCDILELDAKNREDKADPAGAIAAVQARMNDFTAEELASMFEGRDCCCSIVKSISEAFSDPHFIARGLFAHQLVKGDGQAMSAIPVSIVPEFRSNPSAPRSAPGIGEHNDEILKSDA